MSNAKKLVHTVACLIALSVISIPFYTASLASNEKTERYVARVYDSRMAALTK